MYIEHNYLKTYRRRSGLKQSDIVSVLNLNNRSSVGLWERGKRKTSLDIILMYYLLFEIPIDHMFERQKHLLLDGLEERIAKRINQLKALPYTPDVSRRIAFLMSVLDRISPNKD